VEKLRAAEKEIERIRLGQLLAAAGSLASDAAKIGPVNVVAHRADGAAGGDVRTLALDVRGRLPQGEPGVVVILGAVDGKASVVAALNDRARELGLSANELVRAIGPLVGGKGGGKADVAQGGGTDTSRLDEAVTLVSAEVARAVGA
jgi:alanyl-tRNA synthetase